MQRLLQAAEYLDILINMRTLPRGKDTPAMLRSVDPLLSPDMLYILRSMGHGDEVAIVDANFPADSHAQKLVRCDAASATDVVEATIGVLPLDSFSEYAAFSMQVVDDAEAVPGIVAEFQAIIDRKADFKALICPLERFEFYERAKNAYAIFSTGEFRLYGNLILKKGVISPQS